LIAIYLAIYFDMGYINLYRKDLEAVPNLPLLFVDPCLLILIYEPRSGKLQQAMTTTYLAGQQQAARLKEPNSSAS
jgi:hypothetical protein